MTGARPTYQLLDAFVDAMTAGRVPTSPTFVCRICCGPASASASPRGDVLTVSVRCPCSAMELDGVPKWPGWEALLSPPPAGFVADPLGLTRRDRPRVGIAFDTQRTGDSVPWESKQTILADALERGPFIRLPRRDRLPRGHAHFAPPELTDYLFADDAAYERAVVQNGEVEDGLPEWSRRHPSVTFAFVSAACFGGTCLYGGCVVSAGSTVVRVGAEYAGHLARLAYVGLNLGSPRFAPFARGYFEHGRT